MLLGEEMSGKWSLSSTWTMYMISIPLTALDGGRDTHQKQKRQWQPQWNWHSLLLHKIIFPNYRSCRLMGYTHALSSSSWLLLLPMTLPRLWWAFRHEELAKGSGAIKTRDGGGGGEGEAVTSCQHPLDMLVFFCITSKRISSNRTEICVPNVIKS